MNFAKFEFKKKLQRIVAKVTLVAMVATMMPAISAPVTAQAAEGVPEEIILTDHGYGTKGNVDYTSLNGLGSCTIHLHPIIKKCRYRAGTCTFAQLCNETICPK